jgi:hypothetical protein
MNSWMSDGKIRIAPPNRPCVSFPFAIHARTVWTLSPRASAASVTFNGRLVLIVFRITWGIVGKFSIDFSM